MISERDKKILDEFATRLREKCPDARVWAFGSRARGDNNEFSDFDVCVVADKMEAEDRQAILDAAWDAGVPYERFIIPIWFTRKQFDESPLSETLLVQTIREEGIAA
ncbi:MAG: nucleotidyltransferase domain-containing protein [Candidatus Sumerlaeota bacterium]|nr:nucleotidyltransferase domain-containing protein [Candidatus Sumerlaeota bacterium]